MGSLTPNLGLTVPTVGGDSGPAFANEVNADLSIIDAVLGGVNNLNVGGSANITANTAQSQNFVHNLTGVLTGNIVYFLPPTGRFYAIQNNTTGAFLLAVAVSGGLNSITIPQGLSVFIWSDGQTVRLSNPPGWTEISNTALNGATAVTLALPAPFRRFRLTGQGITGTNGGGLHLQASSNGGSSFSTTYSTLLTRSSNDIAAAVPSITAVVGTATDIGISASFWAPNAGWNDFTYDIFPGSLPGNSFTLRGSCWGLNSAFSLVSFTQNAQTAMFGANAIGIFTPVGTFTGTLIVEGLP